MCSYLHLIHVQYHLLGFILDGTYLHILMYLLYSVSNKYLELSSIIIHVAQYHLTVCPKGLIIPFSA